MKNLLDGIEEILLMGPGPSHVPPEVYKAMTCKTLGYLDPYFILIMDEIQYLLRKLFMTDNEATYPVSGTGSSGMETCLVNLIEPKDRVLILVNGVFGKRMIEVASRLGANVSHIEFKWGTPILEDKIEDELSKRDYKIIAAVHGETSTGVKNPIENIVKLVKETDSLFLVDCVTTLGGMQVNVDKCGLDAVYSGSQKCLSCPPGLAPVTFSEKAFSSVLERKEKVPSFYFDASLANRYWSGEEKRIYHHTAPSNMIYGLYQALQLVFNEGIQNVFKRHIDSHNELVKRLEEMDLQLMVDKPHRLPMLNTVRIPEGVDDVKIRRILREHYKIEIGGGLGPLAGKIWRIGLMGHTATLQNVERLTETLKHVIKKGH
ncbi:MAG: pyridoxal-phosphate-dependent aminotransferase family protein [Candidatus Heimdallarchaeota archaeon]